MRKLMSLFIAAILVPFLPSCVDNNSGLEREILVGRAWVRDLDRQSFEGFYLSPDHRVLLLNNLNQTGDQWSFRQEKLILWQHPNANPQPHEYGFDFELDEMKLTLRPDDGNDKVLYTDSRTSVALENIAWTPYYVFNPSAIPLPDLTAMHLKFDPATRQFRLFSGKNLFAGHYQLVRPTGISFEDMPDPDGNAAFPDYFIDLLDSADTFLIVRETLFLYHGTKLLAAWHTTYY